MAQNWPLWRLLVLQTPVVQAKNDDDDDDDSDIIQDVEVQQ